MPRLGQGNFSINCSRNPYIKLLLVLGIVLFNLQMATSQETEEEKLGSFHRITVVMGNTHIPSGYKNEGREWLVMTSWGLDYDFWFNKHWAVGLHSDVVIENFEIESEEGENSAERSTPVSLVLSGLYKPGEHLTLLAGAGIEVAKEENLTILRLGVDYGWELPGEWEIGISLMNDFKLNAYNSWTFGLGVSKILFTGGKTEVE